MRIFLCQLLLSDFSIRLKIWTCNPKSLPPIHLCSNCPWKRFSENQKCLVLVTLVGLQSSSESRGERGRWIFQSIFRVRVDHLLLWPSDCYWSEKGTHSAAMCGKKLTLSLSLVCFGKMLQTVLSPQSSSSENNTKMHQKLKQQQQSYSISVSLIWSWKPSHNFHFFTIWTFNPLFVLYPGPQRYQKFKVVH